jgi:hypothetical protein
MTKKRNNRNRQRNAARQLPQRPQNREDQAQQDSTVKDEASSEPAASSPMLSSTSHEHPEVDDHYDRAEEYRAEPKEDYVDNSRREHLSSNTRFRSHQSDLNKPLPDKGPENLFDDSNEVEERFYRWEEHGEVREFQPKSYQGERHGETSVGHHDERRPRRDAEYIHGSSIYTPPSEQQRVAYPGTLASADSGSYQTITHVPASETTRQDGYFTQLTQYMQAFTSSNNEVEKLKRENATLTGELARLNELQISWESKGREMDKLKTKLDQLQTEALASVDRFQPEFDETIVSAFRKIDLKMQPVLSLLGKQKLTVEPEFWAQEAEMLMWDKTKTTSTKPFDYGDKEQRKKVLRAIVWKLVKQELFEHPFSAFDSGMAQQLNSAYKKLWKEPHKDEDSAKWRSISARGLASEIPDNEADTSSTYPNLISSFNAAFARLGYPALADLPQGEKKVSSMLEAAIQLSQMVAKQRAIFELWEPENARKKANDPSKTNVDRAYDEIEELEGKIWFLIQPGLVKWGTGKGTHLSSYTVLAKAVVELA